MIDLEGDIYINECLTFCSYAAIATFENVGSLGVVANLTIYLVKRFNFGQLTATNTTSIFFGTLNFAPLLGAFISDAYLGRFRTLVYGSFFSLLVCLCHGQSLFISSVSPSCISKKEYNFFIGITGLPLISIKETTRCFTKRSKYKRVEKISHQGTMCMCLGIHQTPLELP